MSLNIGRIINIGFELEFNHAFVAKVTKDSHLQIIEDSEELDGFDGNFTVTRFTGHSKINLMLLNEMEDYEHMEQKVIPALMRQEAEINNYKQ